MSDIISDLMSWLENSTDPVTFLSIFFVFAILATIVLPIPVEFGLIIGAVIIPYPILAIVLGLGKGVGSLFVFGVGYKLEPKIRKWSTRWKFFAKFISVSEAFVSKYRHYALYVLLSIPLMLDTVPIYLFSLLNKDGKEINLKWFVLTNILAGINRANIIGLMLFAFGVNLVSA